MIPVKALIEMGDSTAWEYVKWTPSLAPPNSQPSMWRREALPEGSAILVGLPDRNGVRIVHPTFRGGVVYDHEVSALTRAEKLAIYTQEVEVLKRLTQDYERAMTSLSAFASDEAEVADKLSKLAGKGLSDQELHDEIVNVLKAYRNG